MTKKQLYLVSLAAIIIIVIIGLLSFEIKDIPDLKWKEDFHYTSKQPNGTWIFHELLKERFANVPILRHYYDTLLYDIESSENLYILFAKSVTLNTEETDDLLAFVGAGNEALILCENFNLSYNDYGSYEDATAAYIDTAVSISFEDKTTDNFRYIHYQGDFITPQERRFFYFNEDFHDVENHEVLATDQEDHAVFDEWMIEEGKIYYHLIPTMFTNQASKQPFYLDHFNKHFRAFDPKMIILDHPAYNLNHQDDSQSPLQYILANSSLRWSYYLLMISVLLYIVFRGKRKQKAIPTMEPNQNTSLEYVKTLSNLFMQQGQHRRLVLHLQSIFLHKVKEMYFLDFHDREFVDKLSRKSKISQEHLQQLIDEFERISRKLNVGPEALTSLYLKLDHFYTNCK